MADDRDMVGKRENGTAIMYRGGGFSPEPVRHVALIAFAVILSLWQLGSVTGFISELILPSPLEVIAALRDLALSGDLWRHIQASLFRLLTGWSLGTTAGLLIGLALGLSSMARAIGVPVEAAQFPICVL
jgi:NitT/TauT family transport system permease protein